MGQLKSSLVDVFFFCLNQFKGWNCSMEKQVAGTVYRVIFMAVNFANRWNSRRIFTNSFFCESAMESGLIPTHACEVMTGQ